MTKSVLITGANRGIGQQVARVLAKDGWDVLVGARDKAKGTSAAARLRDDTGGRLKGVEIDVASDASVTTAAQKLRDGAIKLDALVNNAGVYGVARGESGVVTTMETNFFGPLRVTLAMLPLLQDGATITNVTSGLGALENLDDKHRRLLEAKDLTRDELTRLMREFTDGGGKGWGTDAYGISKAALNALSRVLATELAPRGIRVNSTCPGWVRTDMGGRGAPRSVEEGAASVLYGVTAKETGSVFRDGKRIAP
ncbi:MAG TPA: SDR family NAD(P)-dependent oxidoreductase [Kofleriaceae bacterium]|jgi:NAD(P)-dependent dehydrogenase (short-subunit alcohol dehydrogenase family)